MQQEVNYVAEWTTCGTQCKNVQVVYNLAKCVTNCKEYMLQEV